LLGTKRDNWQTKGDNFPRHGECPRQFIAQKIEIAHRVDFSTIYMLSSLKNLNVVEQFLIIVIVLENDPL
jgi:hypothetical protein